MPLRAWSQDHYQVECRDWADFSDVVEPEAAAWRRIMIADGAGVPIVTAANYRTMVRGGEYRPLRHNNETPTLSARRARNEIPPMSSITPDGPTRGDWMANECAQSGGKVVLCHWFNSFRVGGMARKMWVMEWTSRWPRETMSRKALWIIS